jgi:predicted AAA+ superfamily ATPase
MVENSMVCQYNIDMIHRDIEDLIDPWLERDKIIILKGARQVGKTTILQNIQKKIEKAGKKVRYIAADLDFADPAFGDPRLFLLRLADMFGENSGYVLIDEFQTIPQAGLFLKTIYDQCRERYRFIVTGSSSLELSKNAEFLTGRKIEFIIRPFSFREFVRSKGEGIPDRLFDPRDAHTLETHAALYGIQLRALYAEYLHFGGYPEAVLSPSDIRLTLLKELLSTYILKDVAGYQRVGNVAGFNNLVRVLSAQIGSQVNRSELGSTLRLNQETVSRYLDILEGTFVFHLVPPWFTNPRKEVSKMPKAYVTDPGYLIASGAGKAETVPYELSDGHLVENALWLTLCRSFEQDSIRYWRTASGAEIDFIVDAGSSPLPVEIKFTGSAPHEGVAIRNFRETYAGARPAVIISRDHISVPRSPGSPLVIPAFLADFISWDQERWNA